MANPYERMIFELAEQKRQNAVQDRMGTIYQVWCNNGEQKVRVQIGTRPDGSPWLSPWLHTEDPRGSKREEFKYHVGQNVKLSGIGGDMRQATITPWAENQVHQRPNHATDNEQTEQYDTTRETHGRDFHEHWLAKQSAQNQQSTEQPLNDGSGMSNTQLHPEQQDDVLQAITLVRHGNRPQVTRSGQPGQGPAPEDNAKPTPKILVWSKGANGKNQPPDVNNEIHTQYGDNTKSIHNDGTIIHAVSSGGTQSGSNSIMASVFRGLKRVLGGAPVLPGETQPGDGGTGDGSDASTTTITADKITHRIGNSTVLTMLKNNITAIVGGGSGGGIMPEMMPGILGGIQSVMSQMMVPLNLTPQAAAAMASQVYSVAAGFIGNGLSIGTSNVDVAGEVSAAVASVAQMAPAISTVDQAMLSTALQTQVTSLVGSSYAITPGSVTSLAAELSSAANATGVALDTDQLSALANTVAAAVVNQSVLNSLPLDLNTIFETSDENLAAMESAITNALNGGTLGGRLRGSVGGPQVAQIASSISSLMKGLSGGSVWSLLPNKLSHRTQQDHNTKSQQNIIANAQQQIFYQVGSSYIQVTAGAITLKSPAIITDGPTYLNRGNCAVMVETMMDANQVYAPAAGPDPELFKPIPSGTPPAAQAPPSDNAA